ncbi:hypothetical protein D3C71_2153580 [compost metagenome]
MSIANNVYNANLIIEEIRQELQSLEMWSWDELLEHIPQSEGVESAIVSSIQNARRKLERLAEKIG